MNKDDGNNGAGPGDIAAMLLVAMVMSMTIIIFLVLVLAMVLTMAMIDNNTSRLPLHPSSLVESLRTDWGDCMTRTRPRSCLRRRGIFLLRIDDPVRLKRHLVHGSSRRCVEWDP